MNEYSITIKSLMACIAPVSSADLFGYSGLSGFQGGKMGACILFDHLGL